MLFVVVMPKPYLPAPSLLPRPSRNAAITSTDRLGDEPLASPNAGPIAGFEPQFRVPSAHVSVGTGPTENCAGVPVDVL